MPICLLLQKLSHSLFPALRPPNFLGSDNDWIGPCNHHQKSCFTLQTAFMIQAVAAGPVLEAYCSGQPGAQRTGSSGPATRHQMTPQPVICLTMDMQEGQGGGEQRCRTGTSSSGAMQHCLLRCSAVAERRIARQQGGCGEHCLLTAGGTCQVATCR